MEFGSYLGGLGAVALLLVYAWVGRSVPRAEDDSLTPITLDLHPRLPRPGLRFPTPKPEPTESYIPIYERIYTEQSLPKLTPEVLAALWSAGELLPEQLSTVAGSLLKRGFDGPALRRLAATEGLTTRREAEPLAEHAFREQGIVMPSYSDAVEQVLIPYLARQVVDRSLRPEQAVLAAARLDHWAIKGPAADFVASKYAYEDELELNPVSDLNEINEQVFELCLQITGKEQQQDPTEAGSPVSTAS